MAWTSTGMSSGNHHPDRAVATRRAIDQQKLVARVAPAAETCRIDDIGDPQFEVHLVGKLTDVHHAGALDRNHRRRAGNSVLS